MIKGFLSLIINPPYLEPEMFPVLPDHGIRQVINIKIAFHVSDDPDQISFSCFQGLLGSIKFCRAQFEIA